MFPRQGFKTATIYKIIQDLNNWLEDQNPNQSNYFSDQFRKVSETKIPKAKCMNFEATRACFQQTEEKFKQKFIVN